MSITFKDSFIAIIKTIGFISLILLDILLLLLLFIKLWNKEILELVTKYLF